MEVKEDMLGKAMVAMTMTMAKDPPHANILSNW
jgi:hypothetical protein